jgi:hypothetical protein
MLVKKNKDTYILQKTTILTHKLEKQTNEKSMVNEHSLFNTTEQYDLHRRQCQFYDK